MLLLQIRGTPWTTDYRDRRINVTNLDTFFDVKDENNPQFIATVQQSLQPGTNCTFYLCYKQRRASPPFNPLGKVSPVSCVTGKFVHTHTHTQAHTHTLMHAQNFYCFVEFICCIYSGTKLVHVHITIIDGETLRHFCFVQISMSARLMT